MSNFLEKDKAAKEEPRSFPPETRLNINGATAQMIADHIKGIGLKTVLIDEVKYKIVKASIETGKFNRKIRVYYLLS